MKCYEEIARSITMDCNNPIVAGYTGRGVLIPWERILGITFDLDNPRKIKSIALLDSQTEVCAIDASGTTNPMEGSTTTGSSDSGFYQFVKVVSGRILQRGAAVSKDLVEPLVKSTQGYLAILEKKDKVGDGSYEVIGAKSPLTCVDPSTVVRNENENGGSISFSLQSTEVWFELTLCPEVKGEGSQYAASKSAFEDLYEQAFE